MGSRDRIGRAGRSEHESSEPDDLPIIELDTDDAPPPERLPSRGTQRRRTAILAGIVLVVAAGVIITAATSPRHHSRTRTAETIVLPSAPPNPPSTIDPAVEFVSEMGVVPPHGAWALNGLELALTNDGTTFRTITPPSVPNPVQYTSALAVLDARNAWVAISAPRPTVWRTADGGRVWQPANVNVCGGPCGPVVGLDFLDVRDGWASFVDERGGGALAVTDDGGTTWRGLGPTPFLGPIHFADAQHGWATSRIQPGSIFRTNDGGSTWSSVTRPEPTAKPFGVPVFLGAHTALTASVAPDGRVVVARSTDGGSSWSTFNTPLRFVRSGVRFTATSLSDWVLLDEKSLYVTTSAGRRWVRRTPTGTSLRDVAFITPTEGWLLADAPQCGGPITGCIDQYLYGTVDGGRTWTLRGPSAGVTANRSP